MKAILSELGHLLQGVATNVIRHDELLRVQAKLIKDLCERVDELEHQTELAKSTINALWPRNQYGLTESEARLAHACIQIGLHGTEPSRWSQWKPWPLCHCQRDPEASEDARALDHVEKVRIYDVAD